LGFEVDVDVAGRAARVGPQVEDGGRVDGQRGVRADQRENCLALSGGERVD